MGDQTGIEWTDATWNPIVGCSVVSPGCTNCYAMDVANRLLDKPGSHYEGTTKRVNGRAVWTGKVALAPDSILTQPMRWTRARKVFVNSMGDVFAENVPDEWIDHVFAVMALSPKHTFQLLTKRPDRMRAYLSDPQVVRRICSAAAPIHRGRYCSGAAEFSAAHSRAFNASMRRWWGHAGRLIAWTHEGGAAADLFKRNEPGREYPSWVPWPFPNVWLGTSVEDHRRAEERIPLLREVNAAVRFLSIEPLLGDLGKLDLCGIHWVIVGGESGKDARAMDPDWVRSIRDQCIAQGVPFFFKQWGEWSPWNDGMSRIGKHAAGRLLDGREWNDYPVAAA